jgi:small-conductance mechanosensitive channel
MNEYAGTPTVPQTEAARPGGAANPVEELVAPGGSAPSEGLLPFFDPAALPMVIFVLIATALVVRGLGVLARRIGERATQYRLTINLTNTFLGFAAWALAGVVAVTSLFDLSSQALFALSGTLAVAAGFLLKDVAESVVAGVSILINKPFQVGDRITFGSFYGEVKEIGLRTVRLVTLDDNLVTIPSSKFLSEPVASVNAGARECMVVMPFYLSPRADHKRAREIAHDAVLSSRFLYLGKPISVLVSTRLAEEVGSVVQLTAKAYVYDTRYEKQFASDVTDQALAAFRDEGIELASVDPAAA